MNEQLIRCPHCSKEFPISEAISHSFKENLLAEVKNEVKKKEQELAKREQDVEHTRLSIQEQVLKQVESEKLKIEKEAKEKAEKVIALKVNDLQEQLNEKVKESEEFQKVELDLRKQQRKLEEEKKSLELEVLRRLDAERKEIEDVAVKKTQEEHRLKDLEKEKQLADMKKQIDELKRKAEQGSQKIQGEVLEEDLENILKANFPHDEIEPVPNGKRGADVLHRVLNNGKLCGTIIWESKSTKAWSDKWLSKLKDDQRDVNAEVAVLLSKTLPKEINSFGLISDIWITDYPYIIGLATVLRLSLINISIAKLSSEGKNEKTEILYNYICSTEFRQKVEAVIESFNFMRADLEQEKTAMTKIWSKREKQIQGIIENVVCMYGGMEGILGASLPQIKSLELANIPLIEEANKNQND